MPYNKGLLTNKQQQGFTIIEVMIVLVIAAVILLIVLLAVPALQRNSRNTQRKNDVAGLLSGINEWTVNNGGQYPSGLVPTLQAVANTKMGFYTVSGSTLTFTTSPSGDVANNTTTDTLNVVTNAKCKSDGSATKASHVLSVLYSVETGGGGSQPVCQSS